jgi:hypothetical protein
MKTTGFKLYQFHNFQLLDADDKPVGLIDWIWADEAGGEGEFIGVHLNWFHGTARVVPAHTAQIDVQARTIRVSYPQNRIAMARRYAINRPLTAAQKQAIIMHYAGETTSAPRRLYAWRQTA